MDYIDKQNKKIAATLRSNMTRWENKLWYDFLKKINVKFRRQQRIEGYIVDFYSPKAKIIIELDGSQHHADDNICKSDAIRDTIMAEKGIEVIRIENWYIDNRFCDVCKYLVEKIQEKIKIKVIFQEEQA